MTIERLDHLVLTVRKISETCVFYERVMGLRTVTFGDGRRALVFGNQKINLHEFDAEFEPKAAVPTPGSADICFISHDDPAATIAHLRACGVETPTSGSRAEDKIMRNVELSKTTRLVTFCSLQDPVGRHFASVAHQCPDARRSLWTG